MKIQDERLKKTSWLSKSFIKILKKIGFGKLSVSCFSDDSPCTTFTKRIVDFILLMFSPLIEVLSIFGDALYMDGIRRLWIKLDNQDNLNDAKYLTKGLQFYIPVYLCLIFELIACYKIDSYDVQEKEEKLEEELEEEIQFITSLLKEYGLNDVKRAIDTYNTKKLTELLKKPLSDEIHKSHLIPKKSAITLLEKFSGRDLDIPSSIYSIDQYCADSELHSEDCLFEVFVLNDEDEARCKEFVFLDEVKDEINKRFNKITLGLRQSRAKKRYITKGHNLILYYKYILLLFVPVPIISVLEYFIVERMGPIDSIGENTIIVFNNIVTLLFMSDILIKIINLTFINLEDLKMTWTEMLPVVGGFSMITILIIRFCVNVKWIGNPNKHINIEYRNILENYNNTKQINISEYDLQTNPLEVGAIQPLYDRNKSGFKCNQFNWNLAKFYWFDHLIFWGTIFVLFVGLRFFCILLFHTYRLAELKRRWQTFFHRTQPQK